MMDEGSESISWELRQSTVIGHINGASAADHSDLPAACLLCQRILSPDNEFGDLEVISICGDCKFLFLEEFGSPTVDGHRRRPNRVRRTRHSSSESIANSFSQQFSDMISLARQGQPTAPDHENQTADSDAAARWLRRTHSRRWRRVPSDTESDGFDSLYGENESNVSFSGSRLFQSESDAISFSTYGGESDASVDGHSFLDNEMFIHPDAGSDLDSDTDIDPMRAGINQWNSEDQEEEDEDEDEWEEADAEENAADSSAGAQLRSSLGSSASNGPATWHRELRSPEFEGAIQLRTGERRQTYIPNIFANLEVPQVLPDVGNSGDYLDARGFDEMHERLAALAEAVNSRRGALPAAVSFVNSLPGVVIDEDHEKQDGLACAICQEFLSVGTVVNQLPCFHLYHPSCILPWLHARNSCPLCRYELPTDDTDYERRKRNTNRSLESGRGRWFFLAAAPIVSFVGIAIVFWLGNSLSERNPIGCHGFPGRGQVQHPNHGSGSWPPNQRESRRWWFRF